MNHQQILNSIGLSDEPAKPAEVQMEKTASATLVDEIRSYISTGITMDKEASHVSLMEVVDGFEKHAGISSPYAKEFIKKAQMAGKSDEEIVSFLEMRHNEFIEKTAAGFMGSVRNIVKNMIPNALVKNRAIGANFGGNLKNMANTNVASILAKSQVLDDLAMGASKLKAPMEPGFFKRIMPGFNFGKHRAQTATSAADSLYRRILAAERAGVSPKEMLPLINQLGGKGSLKRIGHDGLRGWHENYLKLIDANAAKNLGAVASTSQAVKAFAKKNPVLTGTGAAGAAYAVGTAGDGDSSGGGRVVML